MKKASIISVGNELLAGQTLDSNSAYISSRLLSGGLPVVGIFTTADEIDSIVKFLQQTVSDSDVVIMTGGLGPTDDDVTRQALAQFLGVQLELRDELVQRICNFFMRRNIRMPDRAKDQAYIPVDTRALTNNLGTAPGIMAEYKGKKVVALPGVPAEMKQIFEDCVFDELKAFAAEQAVLVRKLRCFGTGESQIAEKLGVLMRRDRNPLINCTAAFSVITLDIIANAGDKQQAEKMLEEDEERLRGILGDLVYGSGEQTLAQVAGEELARQNKTLAVAESCTGGLLTKLITDVPGASRYFTHGWITYSNRAKIDELGLSPQLIEEHGAVSEQVAQAMAQGARRRAKSTFAIGITGIAGPTGETRQKPVGLVHIAIDSENGCEQRQFLFSHDRQSIRFRAAQTALNILRVKLGI